MNRFFGILSVSLVTGSLFAAYASGQTAKAGELKLEPYVFESTKGEKVDAEFGRLTVPENREAPKGKFVELAFVRFKKTGSGTGVPTIYLAGGPGGSGIAAARGTRFPLFMAMREFGDVIAFDQRGTGQSTPSLACKNRLDFPPEKAAERNEMIKLISHTSRTSAEQLRAQGIDLSAYNTVESADDVEDLRKALGVTKLNLWGISYGTHLGLAFIKRHPSSVERAVLAGVNGLDDRRKLPSDAEETLVKISNLAKRDSELAAIVSDLHSLIGSVLADLDKGPVTTDVVNPQTKETVKIGVSKLDVQFLTAQNLGSARFIRSMPALYYAMSKGDYKEFGQMLAGMKFTGLPGSAMYFAMDCASGGSAARYARIKSEESKTLLGNAFNFVIADSCASWNVTDLGAEFRKPVSSNVPVLMISGTLDGRTPPSRAEDARKGFRNSSHLIVDGASHDDDLFLSTPVIKDTILAFMNGVRLPETKTISVDPPLVFRKPVLASNGSEAPISSVQQLEKEVLSLMEKADIPGLSIALIKDGKPYWNRGFGVKNSQTKEPVTAATVFEAASLSKPVFAYAVLKLVDQGKLDLDVPLNTYLPGNYDAGDDVRINKITARKVLSHTTGFPNWRNPRGSKTLPIHFEPGERFSYSGEGFVYLSRVVEAITKMRFEDYVNESVFKQLGMNSSSFEFQERYKQLKSYNHDFIGNPTGQGESNDSNAAGSMLTTTADYALFISAVLNGTGLKKETRANMLTPQSTVNEACRNCINPPIGNLSKEVFWGLGVGLQQTADGTSFWHWGDNGNNKAFFSAFDKQKDGIVMLTNSANGLLILEDILATSFSRKFPAVKWINVGRFDSPARVLLSSIVKQGNERAIADYKKRRSVSSDQMLDEARINSMGYDLLRAKKVDEAMALFTLNTQDFPKSSNVWDSLGEAYMVKGDKPKAIENYRKALELDPNNKGAIENLKKLEQ